MNAKKVLSLMPAAAFLLTMAIPAAAATHKPAAPAATAPSAKAVPASPAPPEKHPQIEAAMASLQNAKEHLEHAAHDFGGHRVDAIRAIEEAQRQLKICMEYDKK